MTAEAVATLSPVVLVLILLGSILPPLPDLPSALGPAQNPIGAPTAGWTLSPGGDFPTYLGSVQRTDNASEGGGILNMTNAPGLRPLWHFATGATVASQPIVANGLVYFGSWDGYEYAVYATNGTLRWKTFLGQDTAGGVSECGAYSLGVTSTATYTNGTIFVNGGTPTFFALNSSTGDPLWNVSLGTSTAGYYLWSSPLVIGDAAYVGISSRCDDPLVPAGMAEISTTTHQVVNYFNSSVPNPNGSSVWSTPSMNTSSDTIFLTTGNPYNRLNSTFGESVVSLNASTLHVEHLWAVPLTQRFPDGDFGSTPTLFTPVGGPAMVAAINKDGYLYAWYQSNLTLKWEDQVSDRTTITSAAFADNLLYVYSPATVINGVDYNSSVRAINPLTGAYVWQVGLQKYFVGYSAPLWFNGMLFVGANTQLLILNSANGAILKDLKWNLGGSILPTPSTSRSEVFVAAGPNLTALDLPLTISAMVGANGSGGAEAFNATVRGGLPPYSYNWSFADGSYSSSASPSHTYSSLGPYHVTVVVTDLAGSVATYRLTVEANLGFKVIFWENGLPTGTRWSVTVGNATVSSANPISFTLPNGTYSYFVANVANYSRAPTGSFTVDGAGMTVFEKFSLVRYTVTFKETGLPVGTNWSVTVGATTLWSRLTYINFHLTNGSYSYIVANVANYSTSPSGTFTVAGTGLTLAIPFALIKNMPTITESVPPFQSTGKVFIGPVAESRSGVTESSPLAQGTLISSAKALT